MYNYAVEHKFHVLLKVRIDNLCNETNMKHKLSLIYFVTQPLEVSGICCPSSGGIHCICTAVGTCFIFKWTGCWPGQGRTPS
jgi:hypothetical protein